MVWCGWGAGVGPRHIALPAANTCSSSPTCAWDGGGPNRQLKAQRSLHCRRRRGAAAASAAAVTAGLGASRQVPQILQQLLLQAHEALIALQPAFQRGQPCKAWQPPLGACHDSITSLNQPKAIEALHKLVQPMPPDDAAAAASGGSGGGGSSVV